MKRLHKQLLLGTMMATLGLAAMAQNTPPTSAAAPASKESRGMPSRMDRGDPERFQQQMAERQAKRLASLKTKLKLSADQATAWATFSNAMPPPASPHNRLDRNELEKLSTPERIDLMRSRMTQREEALRQRGEATKAFYASLNAEQKKVFDQETLPRQQHGQQHRP